MSIDRAQLGSYGACRRLSQRATASDKSHTAPATRLLAALIVLVAACSGRGGASGQSTSGPSAAQPTQGAPTSTTIRAATSPSARLPAGGQAASQQGRPSNPIAPSGPTGGASQPPGPDTGALSGPGGYARTIMRPQPAARITLQVIEQSGETSNATALNAVTGMLGKVTGKPISVGAPVLFDSAATQWSPTELAAIVQAHGVTNLTGATTAVVHLLLVRGSFQGDQSVLGAAFLGDSFAIFPDQLNGSFTLSSDRTATAIYVHETGHLLGLVDEVLDDHRADPNDPSHCGCHSQDQNSVMYYALDTTAIGQLLSGGPPVDFDRADYDDLARLRAGV